MVWCGGGGGTCVCGLFDGCVCGVCAIFCYIDYSQCDSENTTKLELEIAVQFTIELTFLLRVYLMLCRSGGGGHKVHSSSLLRILRNGARTRVCACVLVCLTRCLEEGEYGELTQCPFIVVSCHY